MKNWIKCGFLAILAILGGTFLVLSFWPNFAKLKRENPKVTSLMKIRGGTPIQSWLPLKRISWNLRRAVIVAEDATFYQHHGIDFKGLKEAFWANVSAGRYKRGSSTITMQVVKNVYLWPHKSLLRKILEIPLAWRMEIVIPKARILEIYLNVAEWGKNIYGAEAAARHYFGKSAGDLNASEAALLAAILPSPLKRGQNLSSNIVQKKQRKILRRMGI
jgi:monofunctional biosynthetic peptidoglycan transglycosylase